MILRAAQGQRTGRDRDRPANPAGPGFEMADAVCAATAARADRRATGRGAAPLPLALPTDGFWPAWTSRRPGATPRGPGTLLAAALGDVSPHQVWRVLKRHGISLRRRRSWCISTDPEFARQSGRRGRVVSESAGARRRARGRREAAHSGARARARLAAFAVRGGGDRLRPTATSGMAPRPCSRPWRWRQGSSPLHTTGGGAAATSWTS